MKSGWLAALLGVACATAVAQPMMTPLATTDRDSLRNVAIQLRAAIVAEDTAEIMKHISHSGLGCTDDHFSYKEVKEDLTAKSGYLHRSLFDTAAFAKECGSSYSPAFPALSDKEFFTSEQAQDQTIEFVPWSPTVVEVIIRSKIESHYQREWDFVKENGEWKIVEGLIVRGCSCG